MARELKEEDTVIAPQPPPATLSPLPPVVRTVHGDALAIGCAGFRGRSCRMDLPGPTTSVGTRTDYSVGPWDYPTCAARYLIA
jgi:hypothetical protein